MDTARSNGQRGAPTAYDNAFRTLQVDCPRLILPVINEIFGKNYSGDEQVYNFANELFPEGVSAPGTRIISDSNITVIRRGGDHGFPFSIKSIDELEDLFANRSADGYQIECESNTPDSTIWIRFYKYGASIAVHTAMTGGDSTDIFFPESALICLRSRRSTPGSHTLRIHAQGNVLNISVPILRLSDYSLDDILDKGLFFLLPFYIFNREKDIAACKEDPTRLDSLAEDYERIESYLDKSERDGSITSFEKQSIKKMTI